MKAENEIWKDIPGYEGLYQVSNLGRVKSYDMKVSHNHGGVAIRKGRVLKQVITKWGYNLVSLCKNGTKKQLSVHRIVANSFLENKELKPQVNHKNGIKTDNSLDNLEWCTSFENMQHAVKTKLYVVKSGKQSHMFGKTGFQSNVSKRIIQYNLNGEIIRIHGSIKQAALEINGCSSSISLCCRGKIKTSSNYKWSYCYE